MAGIILPRLRLEDFAGARLDAIREPHLDRLVKAQIEEEVDLDFKADGDPASRAPS
jgi:hypothetical protein